MSHKAREREEEGKGLNNKEDTEGRGRTKGTAQHIKPVYYM
jgi:hypothetical protein